MCLRFKTSAHPLKLKMVDSLLSMTCAKCGRHPDDILILSCDHNLCLLCAAKNMRREQAKGAHTYHVTII
jgi:hypothetical protein